MRRNIKSVDRRSRQLQAIVRERTIIGSDIKIAFKVYCLATIRLGFIALLQNRASIYCLARNRAWIYCLANRCLEYIALEHHGFDHHAFIGSEKSTRLPNAQAKLRAEGAVLAHVVFPQEP